MPIQQLDLNRTQFINRSIFANSYHHGIGIPIREIYTCSHIQASGLTGLISYDQIYLLQFHTTMEIWISYIKYISKMHTIIRSRHADIFRGIRPNMVHFIQSDPFLLVYLIHGNLNLTSHRYSNVR